MSEKSTTSTSKETSRNVTPCRKPHLNHREMQGNTHINTQYKHKKVANNVSNEIKQKRVVMSEKSTTSTKKKVAM